MKKLIFQGLAIVAFFLASWFLLSQIDWVSVFQIQKVSAKTEKKLGDLLWKVFSETGKEIKDREVISYVDSMVNKVCSENEIPRESLKLHILEKDEVNALALPDGHLVLYTGLILHCDKQEQLAGVISHEIAHIQSGHITKKLVKELGLSMLIGMSTGTGGEAISNAARTLTSSAFDRAMEREADLAAIDYMLRARIDPRPLADFMYKLAARQGQSKYLSWLSTHPHPEERAEYIIEYIGHKSFEKEPPIAEGNWRRLQELLSER